MPAMTGRWIGVATLIAGAAGLQGQGNAMTKRAPLQERAVSGIHPVLPVNEVRQIVTFLFQPGRAADALRIYEEKIKPIYQGLDDLQRFRAYREVESPEPFDFLVVSTYLGMEGMDRANAGLRTPGPSGESAGQLYGVLGSMSQHHHDQFVEMIPALSDEAASGTAIGNGLTVFEYVRVTPGSHGAFEEGVGRVRGAERRRQLYDRSETGRMLLSDGWDYLRIYQISSLGTWQALSGARRQASDLHAPEEFVAARKALIVRAVPGLSVR